MLHRQDGHKKSCHKLKGFSERQPPSLWKLAFYTANKSPNSVSCTPRLFALCHHSHHHLVRERHWCIAHCTTLGFDRTPPFVPDFLLYRLSLCLVCPKQLCEMRWANMHDVICTRQHSAVAHSNRLELILLTKLGEEGKRKK